MVLRRMANDNGEHAFRAMASPSPHISLKFRNSDWGEFPGFLDKCALELPRPFRCLTDNGALRRRRDDRLHRVPAGEKTAAPLAAAIPIENAAAAVTLTGGERQQRLNERQAFWISKTAPFCPQVLSLLNLHIPEHEGLTAFEYLDKVSHGSQLQSLWTIPTAAVT